MPALSPENRLMQGVGGCAMRFAGNFFSEWQGKGTYHTLLAAVVACAVGATACAAVVLSMVSSPTTQPAVSSNSRAIVRNAGAPEATQSVQDHPMAETPSRPAVNAVASGPDEPARQGQENHEVEVHGQESRKHSRVVIRSREPYWRRPFSRFFAFATLQLLVNLVFEIALIIDTKIYESRHSNHRRS